MIRDISFTQITAKKQSEFALFRTNDAGQTWQKVVLPFKTYTIHGSSTPNIFISFKRSLTVLRSIDKRWRIDLDNVVSTTPLLWVSFFSKTIPLSFSAEPIQPPTPAKKNYGKQGGDSIIGWWWPDVDSLYFDTNYYSGTLRISSLPIPCMDNCDSLLCEYVHRSWRTLVARRCGKELHSASRENMTVETSTCHSDPE